MIKILTKKGLSHELNNEDSYFIDESNDLIVGAVFDGCSSGKRSHWASEVFKILFEKNKEILYVDSLLYKKEIEERVNKFFYEIIFQTEFMRSFLCLDKKSFLSTVILFLYHKEEKTFYCKFFGDGSIFLKKEGDEKFAEHVNDEGNMPNYLAYLLDQRSEIINHSIVRRKTIYNKNIIEFMVATDGIGSFNRLLSPNNYLAEESKDFSINPSYAKDFLIHENLFQAKENELEKKFAILSHEGWGINDDLTIIKYSPI